MNLSDLYKKALHFEFLSIEEGVFLFENAPTPELMAIGHQLRMIQKPDNMANRPECKYNQCLCGQLQIL